MMERYAEISACGGHRYWLFRRWANPKRPNAMIFVMLNPSTADGEVDDPTTRRCIKFAQREQCDQLSVLNLFSYRSTTLDGLKNAYTPVGPETDDYIDSLCNTSIEKIIVAAWGAFDVPFKKYRIQRVFELIGDNPIYCLGLNKDGSPKHPLYVRGDAPLIRYPGAEE